MNNICAINISRSKTIIALIYICLSFRLTFNGQVGQLCNRIHVLSLGSSCLGRNYTLQFCFRLGVANRMSGVTRSESKVQNAGEPPPVVLYQPDTDHYQASGAKVKCWCELVLNGKEPPSDRITCLGPNDEEKNFSAILLSCPFGLICFYSQGCSNSKVKSAVLL